MLYPLACAITRRGVDALSIISLSALMGCFHNAPAHAVTQQAAPAICVVGTDAIAVELANRFASMLQTRHPDRVTRLFASDGALQGFASPVARKDYASMREYFLYFLQFEPQIKFEERHVDAGCNYLIDAGSYTWTLKPKDGSEAETVPARYRMVYEYDDGSWRIVEFIEEVTGVASDVSSFAVPDPQTPRAPVALAPKTPAVAGFLKRSTDTTAASKSRKTEKSLDPQPAAVPPFPDSYR